MSEIKIQTDENFYQAIKNQAKKQGITIDDFIKKTLVDAINLNDKKNETDFDKELENSFEKNNKILKALADK